MSRWARVGRGLTAAIVSTFVAALSHLAAGGSMPGTAGLALCLAFSSIICIALTGKRMSRLRLASAVAASQLMFHSLFSMVVSTGVAGAGIVESTSAAVGSGQTLGALSHHTMLTNQLLTAPAVAHSNHELTMVVGHLSAAIITFLALSFGERAIRCLITLGQLVFVRLLSARMPVSLSTVRSLIAISALDLTSLRRSPRVSALSHRGPPLNALA